MLHIVRKLLMKVSTFLHTSPQSKVWTKIMGFQRWENPNFENFKTPNFRIWGQKNIWMEASWLSTKNTIKGIVVVSLKVGL
jgi:hypothetical protein